MSLVSLWNARTTTTINEWYSVTHGNGLFVAVAITGSGNRVMTSPDGITWTIRTSAANYEWRSVTYGYSFGRGLFVAVSSTGSGNRVMTSSDGTNWTTRVSPADNNWYSVTYGRGLFVAVAGSGSGNNVMTSTDGIIWTIQSSPDKSLSSVTYGNGLYVAVATTSVDGNNVMTSPDGIRWVTQTCPANNTWSSVTYGNGVFVAVAAAGSGNRVMTSPDGVTWTIQTSAVAADNSWSSVTYGNGLFVAVATISFVGNRIMTSSDGITWTLGTSPPDNRWRSVTYGNGVFVAVSSTGLGNRVMTSTTTSPIIINFSVPIKTNRDRPFTLTAPSSNSTGLFSYSSSNTSVATISGSTVTIVGIGTTNIKSTQAATIDYTSGTIDALFEVFDASLIITLITNFSVPTKTYGDSPFTLTSPLSNSNGLFSYSSSNTSVATISGSTVTIVGIGTTNITSNQDENNDYTSGTINASFQVIQSSQINPVIITNSNELLYLMNIPNTPNTTTYGNIINSIEINYDLTSSTNKVLFTTGNNVKITKTKN